MTERMWETFWPARLSETPRLGGESPLRFEDPDRYWDSIKDTIETSVGSEKGDKVIFHLVRRKDLRIFYTWLHDELLL